MSVVESTEGEEVATNFAMSGLSGRTAFVETAFVWRPNQDLLVVGEAGLEKNLRKKGKLWRRASAHRFHISSRPCGLYYLLLDLRPQMLGEVRTATVRQQFYPIKRNEFLYI